MDLFEKNIEALSSVEELVLVAHLFSIETNSRYEVFVDEKDPINVNLYDREKEHVFYPQKPIDGVTQRYEEIMESYKRHPVMWLYGVDNGLLLKMLINLEKRLYVIEPEIELLYIVLHLFDFSQAIKEKKLFFLYRSLFDENKALSICRDPDVKAFLKTYRLEVSSEYYWDFFSQDIQEVNSIFTKAIEHAITQDGNDVNDSLIGLDHHLKHLPQMLQSYPLASIREKRKSDFAVIVSTGPSLAKQLPLLKEYAPYMTILCIDASLPILQKEGIVPDFVFSMERVVQTAKFFENLDRELLAETIFMPTTLSHPQTIKNLQGMKQAISMRPFGYTRMFYLHKWGYLGRGLSAANMAFDFAHAAKFTHIAFIGQDLAFGEDGTTHSKGAVYGEVEENYKKKIVYTKGYYGKEVATSTTWLLFLSNFVENIAEAKKDKIAIYNATEGGAYIEGAEHISFAEFAKKLPKKPKKAYNFDETLISKEKQQHYLRRIVKLLDLYINRLEEIKESVEKVFLEVMEQIEMLEKLNREEDLEKIDFDALAQTITKIDSIKDIYEEDKVLRKFTNITTPLVVSAELALAVIMVRESETEIEKKVKMIDWIYEHKSWLFFLAAAIENILFILKTNKEKVYGKLL